MRLLLTGATGFVGANVARRAVAVGHEVVAYVRRRGPLLDGVGIEVVEGDLLDREALAAAAAGCGAVLHVAGSFDPGPGGVEAMRRVHVGATQALLEARDALGIPSFVYCSSSVTVGFGPLDAPGDEDTPIEPDAVYGTDGALRAYFDTKLEGERLAIAAGGVVLCPDYVIGPHDAKPTSGALLLAVARGQAPAYPPGGKCFVDAGDVADAHLLALDRGRPGRRYLLGTVNLSYRDFMAKVAEACGRGPPRLGIPRSALRAAGVLGRALNRVDAHRFAGLEPHVLASMASERYRTGARSRAELGVGATSIEVSIHAALGWYRERGYLRT